MVLGFFVVFFATKRMLDRVRRITLTANRIVDVTSVFDRVQQALAAHETAHLAFDVGAMLSLHRYRSVHGLNGRGYAEAYLASYP